MNKQIIVFYLENKRYAIEIENVIDIYEKMHSVRVPNAEEYIEGIINLRGSVITLINLKKRIKIDKTKEEENVIICEYEKEKCGLLVDEIDGILKLEIGDKTTETDSGFIKGFLEKEDKEIIILDLKQIITK